LGGDKGRAELMSAAEHTSFASPVTQADPARRPQVRPGTRERHPRLDHPLERRPQAVHLDQDPRPDIRTPRRLPQPPTEPQTL